MDNKIFEKFKGCSDRHCNTSVDSVHISFWHGSRCRKNLFGKKYCAGCQFARSECSDGTI